MTWFKSDFAEKLKMYFCYTVLFGFLIFFFLCSEISVCNIISRNFAISAIVILIGIKMILDRVFFNKKFNEAYHLFELVNNSPILSYVLSPDGDFLFGNARSQTFFQRGIDVTIDGKCIEIPLDNLLEEEKKAACKVAKDGKCSQVAKAIKTKNGEYTWYSIHRTPLKTPRGEIYAIATFARNIDAEKRIQEQRETYIATLSHDLKTPALAQMRALELLLTGQMGEFNEQQEEMLKLTLESCHYMYEMVYTLLSTCKFESGTVCLNYCSVDMLTLVRESINEIINLAKENRITVEFEPDTDDYIVDADKIELKRVVINLLSNAINYAFAGTTVRVYLNITKENLVFRVVNSSSYIEPEAMLSLFRKYVSHSEKYNKVGIGLGLYLSKKIIEAHCGEIIAESSKNQSNTFGFTIPRSKIGENVVKRTLTLEDGVF